jgi:hypothetical protein
MSKESTNRTAATQSLAQEVIRPTLLWAGVNSYGDPDRQRQLRQERRLLECLFQAPPRPDGHQPLLLTEAPQTHVFFGDLLRRFHHDASLQMLHLSGFCLGQYLHLQGGLGEEAWAPAQFAHLISRLPGLQLVFLNGCATPELLHALLRKDIPAILATSADQDRTDHLNLAYRFYQYLLQGQNLQEAILHTQRQQKRPLHVYEVNYHLESDRFTWDDQPSQPRQPLPWGLYLQSHHRTLWHWRLRPPRTQDIYRSRSAASQDVAYPLLRR